LHPNLLFAFVDIEPNELDRLKVLYKGEHKKRLGFYKGKDLKRKLNIGFGQLFCLCLTIERRRLHFHISWFWRTMHFSTFISDTFLLQPIAQICITVGAA